MTPAESRALMMRELQEQGAILAAAAAPLSARAAEFDLSTCRTVWAGGCGDSLFAALALTRLFRESGLRLRPASAAEMLWEADFGAQDAAIGLSISGSTRRTVEAIAAARAAGARTLAVTLKPDSALARSADAVLPLPYEPVSRAIPHGLDYHMSLLALAALASPLDGAALHGFFTRETPDILQEARRVAAAMPGDGRFFCLGSGAALGSAHFAAAKLHEAGGLPAWSFEAENFAHGAHFMLREGDHVLLCGSGGPGDRRTADLRDGLEKLGVTVGATGLDPEQDRLLAALRAGLVAQALCLAVAEVRDLNVTDPARGSAAAEVQRDWFGWTAF